MKHSADFWYPVRSLLDPQNIAPGTVTSKIVELQDFMEALILVSVGNMAAGATIDGKVETLDDNDANPLDLEDADGNTVSFVTLTEGVSPDPKNRTYRGRIDAKALKPSGRTRIRLSITVGVGNVDMSAALVATSAYEIPDRNNENPEGLPELLFNHTTKQALISP